MTTTRRRCITTVLAVSALTAITACGHNDDSTEGHGHQDLTKTSPNITWEPGPAGLDTPTSAAGPHETNPVPHDFDDTPHGAVLAAITGQVWMAGADDQTWPEVSRELLEPGKGRDQWAQARTLMSVNGKVKESAEFTGFVIDDYTDDAATVVLASHWPDGKDRAYPVQVSHASGDWKVVLPEQGQEPDLTDLDNTDDFIPLADKDTANEK